MPTIRSREVHLIRRPKGLPKEADFELFEAHLAPPQDGQVLVRNTFISVDPYMRGRMNEGASYVTPFSPPGRP